MKEEDVYYLRSILAHLRELRSAQTDVSIGSEVLADNIDWLDCFIDKWERQQRKQKVNFAAAMRRRREAIAAMKERRL